VIKIHQGTVVLERNDVGGRIEPALAA